MKDIIIRITDKTAEKMSKGLIEELDTFSGVQVREFEVPKNSVHTEYHFDNVHNEIFERQVTVDTVTELEKKFFGDKLGKTAMSADKDDRRADGPGDSGRLTCDGMSPKEFEAMMNRNCIGARGVPDDPGLANDELRDAVAEVSIEPEYRTCKDSKSQLPRDVIVGKWKRHLRLEDWIIKVNWDCGRDEFANAGSDGEVQCMESIKTAIINIASKDTVPSNSILRFDEEQVLLHELLHVKFSFLEDSGNPLQDRIVHQYIEDLARGLLEADRGVGSGVWRNW